MKVGLQHVKIARSRGHAYCIRGMRLWFQSRNLDFKEFCNNGLDEQILQETGDMQAIRLIEIAHGQ